MIPLFVLLASLAGFRVVAFWISCFAGWQHALRAALEMVLLTSASAH